MTATNLANTILYVDDDPDDRQLLSEALQSIDPAIQVLHAVNGIEGLEVIAALKKENSLPCLIILDMNMPLLDGVQTLQHLYDTGIFPEVPVVLFTTMQPILHESLSNKYNVEIIRKPFDLLTFNNEAKRLLGYCRK